MDYYAERLHIQVLHRRDSGQSLSAVTGDTKRTLREGSAGSPFAFTLLARVGPLLCLLATVLHPALTPVSSWQVPGRQGFLLSRPAVLAYLLVLHGTPHAGRSITPFELFQLEEVFG